MQRLQQEQLMLTIKTLQDQLTRANQKSSSESEKMASKLAELEAEVSRGNDQRKKDYEAYKQDALKVRQQRALLMKDNEALARECALALGTQASQMA